MGAFCRNSDRTSAPGNQRRRLTLPPTLGGFWVPHFTAEFARCWPRLSTIFPNIALVVLAYVIYRKGRSSRLKRAPSLDALVWWITNRGPHFIQFQKESLGSPHKSQPILSRFSVRSHISLAIILSKRARPDRGRGPIRRRYRVNQDEQTQERLAHHFTLRSHLHRRSI
jgi:hypothetical protein